MNLIVRSIVLLNIKKEYILPFALLGTEKEKAVLTPQSKEYSQFGQECVGVGCSVDLFLFNNAYIDVATISQVQRKANKNNIEY